MVFIPTYLYIKQHTITGKLYFGKTAKCLDKMLSYKGSGKRWLAHIKNHQSRYVITLWYQLYDNPFDLVADALSMSKSFDIVNNESFLNLRPENGLDGGDVFTNHPEKERLRQLMKSPERIAKISKTKQSQEYIDSHPVSDESRLKMSIAGKGRKKSEEHKRNIGIGLTGRKISQESIQKRVKTVTGVKFKPRSPEQCKMQSERMMGHVHSEDAKRNMSIAHTGKILIEEHKNNIAIASSIRILADGGKNNPNNIRICCIVCHKETNAPNFSKHTKICN